MDLIKKQKIGFWAELVVLIMAAVSLGIYVSNVNKPYYEDMNLQIVYIMVGALVLIAASVALTLLGNGKIAYVLADVCRIAATVLIILSGAMFIGMRVESFGYIFGSNLELGNDAAFEAGGQAITGIVVFVITWLLSVVTSFVDMKKKA